MTANKDAEKSSPGLLGKIGQRFKKAFFSLAMFRRLIRLVLFGAAFLVVYWLLLASDRYVSETNIIIQRTDMLAGQSFDVGSLLAGGLGMNRADQLLLREYLTSVDMLLKLDAAFDLRSHYSDKSKDIISRMWFQDASLEWFHLHYQSRVDIVFDEFAGVLRVKAQAYDPQTAQSIASMLVKEGESYMNQLGHELAQAQVSFLSKEVSDAHERLIQTSQALIDFQNQKGLASPQSTAESLNAIIARLETQRTELQTQLASLPSALVPNHPNIVMLRKALDAVEKQIEQERTKLASPEGRKLNYTIEEFHRLEMEVSFAKDVYKTALVALEKGRMDATRTLKKVSVLQTPPHPEYAMQPSRIYNTVVTLLLALLLAGIIKLLEGIILDHVD